MSGFAAGWDREHSLSEVIGFILLLGVIVAAFALWMVYIVPVNGREAEISQMDTVKDRFTDYKISLDSLWINGRSDVTLSSSMNLGTGGGNTQATGLFLPMLNPIASSATLSVQDTGDTMSITSDDPVNGVTVNTYRMTMLQYQSQNNYWLQQTYYYQDGGVFLSQINGSVCRVSPPISFVNNSDKTYTVTIAPITLNGVSSMGGNGPVRVDSRLKTLQSQLQNKTYWVNTSVSVANYTAAQMWMALFNTSRANGGILDARYYAFGTSAPSAVPGVAFMNMTGTYNDLVNPDVNLVIQPAQYDVTLNSIASNLN